MLLFKPPVEKFTYHHYSLSGHISEPKDYIALSSFKLFEREIKQWTSSVRKLTKKPLLLGETAVAWGGGRML